MSNPFRSIMQRMVPPKTSSTRILPLYGKRLIRFATVLLDYCDHHLNMGEQKESYFIDEGALLKQLKGGPYQLPPSVSFTEVISYWVDCGYVTHIGLSSNRYLYQRTEKRLPNV